MFSFNNGSTSIGFNSQPMGYGYGYNPYQISLFEIISGCNYNNLIVSSDSANSAKYQSNLELVEKCSNREFVYNIAIIVFITMLLLFFIFGISKIPITPTPAPIPAPAPNPNPNTISKFTNYRSNYRPNSNTANTVPQKNSNMNNIGLVAVISFISLGCVTYTYLTRNSKVDRFKYNCNEFTASIQGKPLEQYTALLNTFIVNKQIESRIQTYRPPSYGHHY